jgi:hypothetical protein
MYFLWIGYFGINLWKKPDAGEAFRPVAGKQDLPETGLSEETAREFRERSKKYSKRSEIQDAYFNRLCKNMKALMRSSEVCFPLHRASSMLISTEMDV